MVRLREIISRDRNTDVFDVIHAENISLSKYYKLYDSILVVSKNYAVLPHELSSDVILSFKDEVVDFIPIIQEEFGNAKNTAVWQMMEEMKWYFGIE